MPIYDPEEKVQAFNKFFNCTFILSDFVLPSLDQMPTPSEQLSQITINKSDTFEALMGISPTKAQGFDNLNPCVYPILLHFTSTPSYPSFLYMSNSIYITTGIESS